MTKLKASILGIGVAAANFLASAASVLRPERCTGSCGSCGYACVPAIITLVGAGGLFIAFKKIKARRLKNKLHHNIL
ncbi:MAG TPA: hypothetical protein VF941_02350 [Clostridia bacterium]